MPPSVTCRRRPADGGPIRFVAGLFVAIAALFCLAARVAAQDD
jgi:hypothetical protein